MSVLAVQSLRVKLAMPAGDVTITRCADIVEPVESAEQTPVHLAAVFGAERDSQHFETRPVVQLEQLGHQLGGCVLMEVGREIRNPDPVVSPGPPARARPCRAVNTIP